MATSGSGSTTTVDYQLGVEFSNLTGIQFSGDSNGQNPAPGVMYSDKFSMDIEFFVSKSTQSQPASGQTPPASQSEKLPVLGVTLMTPLTDEFKIQRVSDSIVRFFGNYSNSFDDYYEFVFEDGSIKRLPPDTQEKFMALIQYKMPSIVELNVDYAFELALPELLDGEGIPTTIDNAITITQTAFWNTMSASTNISKLVKQGTA